jgi:hypothetical protein
MKYLKIFFLLITYLGHSQSTEMNNLFFKIPLNESRDLIYQYCIDSNLFTKEKPKNIITKNGKEIKVYSGYLKNLTSELINKKIDSVEIQLSTGNVSFENEKEPKDVLIFWTYYYSMDSIPAKKQFIELKNQISTISKEKPYHFQNFVKEENDVAEKLVGYSEKWYFKNDINLEIELKFEMLEENKKYLIRLEYSRFE